MSLREERAIGGIRRWIKIPTDCMVADGLSKSMISSQILELLHKGTFHIWPVGSKPVRVRTMPRLTEYTEKDLVSIQLLDVGITADLTTVSSYHSLDTAYLTLQPGTMSSVISELQLLQY